MTDMNTPWYARPPQVGTDGDADKRRKTLESVAASASTEDDAMVARIRAEEAAGRHISPAVRLAMGYAQHARLAATELGEASHQAGPQVSPEGTSPEQRLRNGYGSTN